MKPIALSLALLLIGACGPKPDTRAPSYQLASFTLSMASGALTVGADGRVITGGEHLGTLSPDGRFVDADGDVLATFDRGVLRGPNNAVLGEVDRRGTVTQTGETILVFAEDGAVSGNAIADYEQAIAYQGPPDARPVAAMVLVGLADSVAFLKAASRALGGDVEVEAKRFCDALAAGDGATLRAQIISHAALAAVTRRAPTEAEYNAEVNAWVDARVAEIKGAKGADAKAIACARADIVVRETLEPNDRVLRTIEIAAAQPILLVDGAERPAAFPIVFVQVDGAWKASIKK